MNQAAQTVLWRVPDAPEQPSQFQQPKHDDQHFQGFLHPFLAAGKTINGHGRHLPQEHRGAVAQEDHHHGPHGDIVKIVEPTILIKQKQAHQKHGTNLPEQPIEQCAGPADGGGEDQIHIGQGKNRPPFGKPIPNHVKENEQEQCRGHCHHLPGISVEFRRGPTLVAAYGQHKQGHQEHHVDQPGGLAKQVPDGVFQPGQREVNQRAHGVSFPPSVMAKKRSSRLRVCSSSGRLYWVAAKRPFIMMWVTSQ